MFEFMNISKAAFAVLHDVIHGDVDGVIGFGPFQFIVMPFSGVAPMTVKSLSSSPAVDSTGRSPLGRKVQPLRPGHRLRCSTLNVSKSQSSHIDGFEMDCRYVSEPRPA